MTYNIGDTVTYVAFGGGRRTIVVTNKEDNVKNGRPGFDGYIVANPVETVWGYDEQIVSVN